MPLMRSLWLAKKKKNSVALKMVPDQQNLRVDFEILEDVRARQVDEGTVAQRVGYLPGMWLHYPGGFSAQAAQGTQRWSV